MKIKERTKYKLLRDLPGCPAGTEFFAPGNYSPNTLYPEGKIPKGNFGVLVPFDGDWFEEAGRAEEFTHQEMIGFAVACAHSGLYHKEEIEKSLAHLLELKIYGS